MYFLNQALYDEQSNFLGVTLDCYKDDNITERITRKVVDTNELTNLCTSSDNRGFCIKDNAVLSDNNNGYIINLEQYHFIQQATKSEKKVLDITDLILILLECDGCILPDFYNTDKFTGQELIVAKNLRVSKSSFNIYGFMLVDGMYESFSLYDSDTLQPKSFFVGVPSKTDMTMFQDTVKYDSSIFINDLETDVYRCTVPLLGYPTSVADSLVNYLGFYSCAYDIYKKLVESCLNSYAPSSEEVKYRQKEHKRNNHKINITASHTNDGFKDFDTAMTAAISDVDYPITDGLSIAIYYARNLANRFNEQSGTIQEKTIKVCLSLLDDIKIVALKCNLELLSIRYYYLDKLDGVTTNTSRKVFKGGDVYGSTLFKRVGW